MKLFFRIMLNDVAFPCSTVWLVSVDERTGHVFGRTGAGVLVNVNSYELGGIHILKKFVKISKIFPIAFQLLNNHVISIDVYVIESLLEEVMGKQGGFDGEHEFNYLNTLFHRTIMYERCDLATPLNFFFDYDSSLAIPNEALNWMLHVETHGGVMYSECVTIPGTTWLYDTTNRTFTQNCRSSLKFTPKRYVIQVSDQNSKMKSISKYLNFRSEIFDYPYIDKSKWSLNSSSTLLITDCNQSIQKWEDSLTCKVLCIYDMCGLKSVTLHDICTTDVVIVSHSFIKSDGYRKWVNLHTEGMLSPSVMKSYIRKVFYARQSLSLSPALMHAVNWNRVIMDNFHVYYDQEEIKVLEANTMFGISDACACIPRQGLSNFIYPVPRTLRNLLVCQLCTFTKWKSGLAHKNHELTLCKNSHSVSVDDGSIPSSMWIETNVKKYLWFKCVPSWQKKRVMTLLSQSVSSEFAKEQALKYIKGSDTCPICFVNTSNCISNCAHLFCDRCLTMLKVPVHAPRKSCKKTCPCCRCDINKVFTTSPLKDDKLDVLFELCQGYSAAGKYVRVVSHWEDVSSFLKNILKKVKSETIETECIPPDSHVQNHPCDIIIWMHPPMFRTINLSSCNMWILSNMCSKMHVLAVESSPESTFMEQHFVMDTASQSFTVFNQELDF